jgi:hypothetical protein
MKRSEILFRILIGLSTALVIVVFVVPQEVLDNNEIFFLWVVMPIIGWMWIQAYVDASKGN